VTTVARAEEARQVDADTVLERVDVGFRRFCERIVIEAALAAQLAAHWLDWIRMECRRFALPTLESAREAALCVREDGMDLDEVARSAGARVDVVSDFLENWEPARALIGRLVGFRILVPRRIMILVVRRVIAGRLWSRGETSVTRNATIGRR